jgi:hypothetical protein
VEKLDNIKYPPIPKVSKRKKQKDCEEGLDGLIRDR